jgi:hypothetical protein
MNIERDNTSPQDLVHFAESIASQFDMLSYA